MKEKILTLIIGMLIGAIITTGVFLIINKNNSNPSTVQNGRPDMSQMEDFRQGGGLGGKEMKGKNSNSSDANSKTQNNQNTQTKTDGQTPPELPNGEAPSIQDTQSKESQT